MSKPCPASRPDGSTYYNLAMPAEQQETQDSAGISDATDADRAVDVAALLERLREEVRRSGADPGGASGPSDRRALRDEAERLWPVSADRSLRLRPGIRGGLSTPLKAVLRKLMRWYVEPVAYDQRSFNAVTLRLIDELDERLRRLESGETAGR
jgi:hypothetical protein